MIIPLLAVTLSWNASPPANPPVQGYRLYYGPVSGQQTIFKDVGNKTTGEVTGLAPGSQTYFVVRAYNSVGESKGSNEVLWVEPAAPTPTPTPTPAPTPTPTPAPSPSPTPTWQQTKVTGVRVVSQSGSNITITWNTLPGAVRYEIFWDDDTPTGPMPLRANDNSPPNSMGYYVRGKTYYFEVRAVNSAGAKSAMSDRIAYP